MCEEAKTLSGSKAFGFVNSKDFSHASSCSYPTHLSPTCAYCMEAAGLGVTLCWPHGVSASPKLYLKSCMAGMCEGISWFRNGLACLHMAGP